MADTKISALSASAAMLDATEVPVNEAGTTKKVSGTLFKAWFGDSLSNASTADQSPAAATATYLTNSNIAVPTGKLRIGTVFTWRLAVAKTAAGTLANTIIVKAGTLGTTGDTSILTFTTDAGTAVADQAVMDILVTCRGPLSASGIFQGMFKMTSELSATGFRSVAGKNHVLHVTSGAFDVTTASLILGIVSTSDASTLLTFKQVVAEVKNL